ncbi:MAG: hypothetical protein WCT37_04170 [Patescibacteria group bacterium]|jgi:hypothetical protein
MPDRAKTPESILQKHLGQPQHAQEIRTQAKFDEMMAAREKVLDLPDIRVDITAKTIMSKAVYVSGSGIFVSPPQSTGTGGIDELQ